MTDEEIDVAPEGEEEVAVEEEEVEMSVLDALKEASSTTGSPSRLPRLR